jgi:drug/metabolite transporter (DMT)-like permease
VNTKSVLTVFFSQFYNFDTRKLNHVNLFHLIVRSINFFLLAFLIIWASYFAIKAEINFGIVSSAICIGSPLNCILSYIFWKEKMNPKMIVGTTLIIGGVVFVALAKGAP